MIKPILSFALAAGMATGIVACNERDVAIGAGAVGGAIVAGSIYDNYYGRDYRYSRGHYRDGSVYWDRHDGRYYRHNGRWYCDNRNHRCHRHNHWNFADAQADSSAFELAAVNTTATASNREAAVAAKYVINRTAARQVGDAFENVQRYGKLDGFRAMGLSDQDMQRVSRGESASATSVAKIAQVLGAKTSSVQGLLRDVADEYSLFKQGNVEVTN